MTLIPPQYSDLFGVLENMRLIVQTYRASLHVPVFGVHGLSSVPFLSPLRDVHTVDVEGLYETFGLYELLFLDKCTVIMGVYFIRGGNQRVCHAVLDTASRLLKFLYGIQKFSALCLYHGE